MPSEDQLRHRNIKLLDLQSPVDDKYIIESYQAFNQNTSQTAHPYSQLAVNGDGDEISALAAGKPEKKSENQVEDPSLPAPLVIQYLIILRIINAFTINTFFQPDEYFQSLEPAHQLAYGYGDVPWEWNSQLRSFNYPSIFYLVFKIADFFDLGDVGVLLLPKILQGFISAISEYYLYKFAQKVFGHKNELMARTVLLLSVLSTFNWFCFTRTFSNTFELNLTIIALNFWPWDCLLSAKDTKTIKDSQRTSINYCNLTKSFAFAAMAVVVRPSNALIWLVLGTHLLYRIPKWTAKISIILRATIAGSLVLLANALIDYLYYGSWVFPIVNFVQFNLLSSFASFYGINAWHFYLTQALAFILTTYLPFFFYGVAFDNCGFKLKKLFLTVIGVNIAVVSLVAHKEFRFIYQLMPFFLVFAASAFLKFYKFAVSTTATATATTKDINSKSTQSLNNSFARKLSHFPIYLLFIVNLVLGLFFTQIQESGVIEVINFLKYNPDVDSVGFLTPCHSTPLQAHLHRADLAEKGKLWYLSCTPPNPQALSDTISDANIGLSNAEAQEYLANYKDESDIFYENPKLWLDINLPPLNKKFRTRGKPYNYEWPTHLVFFEQLEPLMKQYLKLSKYEECGRFFNSYFHWDWRREGDVVVYCKWPWE